MLWGSKTERKASDKREELGGAGASYMPPSILNRSAGCGRDHPADHPSAHCQRRAEQGQRVY